MFLCLKAVVCFVIDVLCDVEWCVSVCAAGVCVLLFYVCLCVLFDVCCDVVWFGFVCFCDCSCDAFVFDAPVISNCGVLYGGVWYVRSVYVLLCMYVCVCFNMCLCVSFVVHCVMLYGCVCFCVYVRV